MDVRIGALAFVGLLIAAAVVTLMPASAGMIDCGRWWADGPSGAVGEAVCDGPRQTRMWWSLGLLVAAFVVPRAITFVAGRGRERQPF
ncbi:hypothetical protein [Mumia sp. DW29H23]|uniref:hypothetical protein n=1 Tax=Mumia sp. DW29H23 TaxID=3421241 RepID=UPI003D6946A6